MQVFHGKREALCLGCCSPEKISKSLVCLRGSSLEDVPQLSKHSRGISGEDQSVEQKWLLLAFTVNDGCLYEKEDILLFCDKEQSCGKTQILSLFHSRQ